MPLSANRPPDPTGVSPPPRIAMLIAGLMLAEALTLAVASIVHFGVVISLGIVTLNDPFAGARIPEAIIAVVLAVGAISLLTPWAGARWLALAATVFAIVGVLVGLRFVLVATVARPGDLVYHGSLLVLLLATLVLLLRRQAVRDR